jgi:hypothetical protein
VDTGPVYTLINGAADPVITFLLGLAAAFFLKNVVLAHIVHALSVSARVVIITIWSNIAAIRVLSVKVSTISIQADIICTCIFIHASWLCDTGLELLMHASVELTIVNRGGILIIAACVVTAALRAGSFGIGAAAI